MPISKDDYPTNCHMLIMVFFFTSHLWRRWVGSTKLNGIGNSWQSLDQLAIQIDAMRANCAEITAMRVLSDRFCPLAVV